MSNGGLAKAKYYFIPSLRRGLAAGIEGAVGNRHRVELNISMTVDADPDLTASDPPFVKTMELFGPGDILGFDSRIVVRTDPLNNVGDFEPNYFPSIEFSEPDFLWRYTAKAPTNGNLWPWITLVVLMAEKPSDRESSEIIEEGRSPVTNVPFVRVQVKNLPKLSESWRWAHVQVTASEDIDDDESKFERELKRIIRNEPERAVSRLICPRRLRPGMKYHAYVVPTFKLGCERALNNSLPEDIHALTLSWDSDGNGEIKLPYYYKWEFRTGQRGDFEHLIRLLEPRPLPNLGLQEVDCGSPGFETAVHDGLESDDSDDSVNRVNSILKFESALKSTNTYFTPWGKDNEDTTSGSGFRDVLANKLNRSVDLYNGLQSSETPLVVAPVYGWWHRGRKAPLSPDNGDWLDELNLDPRHRSAAAIGSEIVRKNDEQLMASAWDQLGPIQEANEILMRAQFGREVGKKIEKRLKVMMDGNYLRATSFLHARIKMNGEVKTVRRNIHDSPIRRAPLDPALRRIVRKRGSFRKRQVPDLDKRDDMLARLNDRKIRISDALIPARGMANIETITRKLAAAVSPAIVGLPPSGEHYGKFSYSFGISTPFPNVKTKIEGENLPDWLKLIDNGDGTATLTGTPPGEPIAKNRYVSPPKRYRITLRVKEIGATGRSIYQHFTIVVRTRRQLAGTRGRIRSHADRYLRAPTRGLGKKTVWQVVDVKNGQPLFPDGNQSDWFYERNITPELVSSTIEDLADNSLDKVAGEAIAEALTGWLKTDALVVEKRPKIADLKAVRNCVEAELSPEKTMVRRSDMRLKLLFDKPRPAEQALDIIMAAPEFPQPLFKAVEEISQELILRGIDSVRQNTVALLETNPRFIEALICGANHEMARELLWREYPTDQRGSYFRQFFDVKDYVPKDEEYGKYLGCYLTENDLDPNFENWNDSNKSRLIELYRNQLGDVSGLSPEEILEEILRSKAVDEKLYDVPPLHKWKGTRLGKNPNAFCSDDDVEEKLVLLIRGDVLKKYPDTVIYAVDSVSDGNSGFIPNLPEYTGSNTPGEIRYPVFRAEAKPDITFLGFNLAEEEARAGNWYFVLQERISETRFGLDAPSDKVLENWDDLAWHHFDISDDQCLDGMEPTEYLNGVDTTNWAMNSAWLASKTLQKPVRIIISANQILPTEEACFEFRQNSSEDRFVIKLVGPDKIRHARNILKGIETERTRIAGVIVKERASYNPDWNYHLEPGSIQFIEVAVGACSAEMRYVEDHLDEVGDTFLPENRWCPQGVKLTGEVNESRG